MLECHARQRHLSRRLQAYRGRQSCLSYEACKLMSLGLAVWIVLATVSNQVSV